MTGVASPIPRPAEPDPASPDEPVRVPDADPVVIRGCLTPDVAAVFDAEWEFVLEAAKQSKDLAGVRELLTKWRVFAHQELREPGAYFRVLSAAADAQRTGPAPTGSVSGAEMRSRIEARLAEAGLSGHGWAESVMSPPAFPRSRRGHRERPAAVRPVRPGRRTPRP